jgi:hypothetical protein
MARYNAYPAVLYNAAGETVRVVSAAEDEALGDGWMSGHEYFSRLQSGTLNEEAPKAEPEPKPKRKRG